LSAQSVPVAASPKDPAVFWTRFIFFLALGLRLLYWLLLKQQYFFYDHPGSDVTYYQDWAFDIAGGNWAGRQAFFGLPLYPYFLAVLVRLCLANLEAVRLLHILLGSFNCVLIFLAAKKIFSFKTAVLAGLLAATNFIMIYFDWIMMPVPLIIFLSLIILLALTDDGTLRRPRDCFLLGLLLGAVTLGDGKFLFFFLLITGYLLKKEMPHGFRRAIRPVLPLSLGFILVLSAVTLRNRIIGGSWVFISAQSGLSFYVGNNPDATGIYENPDFIRPTHEGQDVDQKIVAESAANKALSAAGVSRFWRQKALDFMTGHPGEYATLLKNKFLAFFSENERANDLDLILQRKWRGAFDLNRYYFLCPLALLGLFLCRRRKEKTVYLELLIASQLIMTLVFFLSTRHRAAIFPFLIMYEAYALAWCWDSLRRLDVKALALTAVFLSIFFAGFRPRPIDDNSLDFLRYAKSGPVYEKRGEFERARENYFKALALRPFDSNTIYNLANTYLNEENFPKAREYYVKALEICDFHVDSLFNLAYTYERTGDIPRALEYYQKVLHYEPDSLDAHYRVATMHQQLGDCPRARVHYKFITDRVEAVKPDMDQLFAQCQPTPPDK